MIPRSNPIYALPPDAYSTPAWFDTELDRLLTDRWAIAGAIDELAAPGDYCTVTVGRAPLIAIRGDDGELRAFHNLCRHRGMMLLQGAGNAGRTVNCFYHQWRYLTSGALEVVPQRKEQFPDLELGDYGLLPAAVATWEGMVFVHPDPGASPLTVALEGLPERIGSHRPGQLVQAATDRIEAQCNWKLLIENHIDVYHLWYLHGESLGDYDHTSFEHHQLGRNWASYEPVRVASARAALTTGTTSIAHLSDRDRGGLGAHLLFPNTMMASAAEFFATYVAEPVAPDRTIIDLRIRAEAGADAEKLLSALHSFIEEDVAACEAVQRAIGSPAFAVGPLAQEHEAPIARFHEHVLEAMA